MIIAWESFTLNIVRPRPRSLKALTVFPIITIQTVKHNKKSNNKLNVYVHMVIKYTVYEYDIITLNDCTNFLRVFKVDSIDSISQLRITLGN